jgi:alpha-galactosidase
MSEFLLRQIKTLNIGCYRQDFNIHVSYWFDVENENNPDRVGIAEIKHVMGLYEMWDYLLDGAPGLIIDNCSSGGRRIDIETLRRSIPLWRSDFQCPSNHDLIGAQAHHMCFNSWMPYSGTGSGRVYDEMNPRSTYDSAFNLGYFFSMKEDDETLHQNIGFIKKYSEEYLALRPYFSEDFYPLTKVSSSPDAWAASQFDRPGEGDGIVQVYKRAGSPYETAKFGLRGIDTGRDYLITDLDGGEFTVSGRELREKGFSVTITESPKAKVFKYKKL